MTQKEICIPKTDPIRSLAQTAFQASKDVKGLNTIALDLRKLTSVADYMIISSGATTRQVQAIADRIKKSVWEELKRHPLGIEGMEHGLWVLIDYGDIICHVFQEELRGFYRIENLWHDAKRVRFFRKK